MRARATGQNFAEASSGLAKFIQICPIFACHDELRVPFWSLIAGKQLSWGWEAMEGRRSAFFGIRYSHQRQRTHCATPVAGCSACGAADKREGEVARVHREVAPVRVIFHPAAKVRVLSLEPPLHTHRDAPPDNATR